MIGYSDITITMIFTTRRLNPYGVMCKSLEDISVDDDSINKLKDILLKGELKYIIERNEYNIIGEASGKLVGETLLNTTIKILYKLTRLFLLKTLANIFII